MSKTRMFAWSLCLALGLVPLLIPGAALAHEHRKIANGKYELVVGWMVEPAFVGEKNGIDLHVGRLMTPAESAAMKKPASTAGPAAGEAEEHDEPPPVEGLGKTLKAEVIFGDQKRTVELRPRWRMPGAYTSDLVPTASGDYRFRFFGTIGGAKVDVTFDSADGKFDGVEAIEAIQFPEKLPSMGQMSQDLSQTRVTFAEQLNAAQAAASSSRTFGYIGILLGLAGTVLGGLAFTRSGGSKGR